MSGRHWETYHDHLHVVLMEGLEAGHRHVVLDQSLLGHGVTHRQHESWGEKQLSQMNRIEMINQ